MRPKTNRRFGAVPYRRLAEASLELLLVRTSAGRWTFPKGKAEAGEDSRTAAVRECFEESGATGVLQSGGCEYVGDDGNRVEVFLLAVERQATAPEASKRLPQWFSLLAAEAALVEGRGPEAAREFTAVIEWVRGRLARLA